MINIYRQLQSVLSKLSSGVNYRIFKREFGRNEYFTYLSNSDCRLITAFRTRNHRFPVETGRWRSKRQTERLCHLCKTDIGDEYHYVMKCENFKEQRTKFLKRYYIQHPNTLKFAELMNTTSKIIMRNFCKFIKILIDNAKT